MLRNIPVTGLTQKLGGILDLISFFFLTSEFLLVPAGRRRQKISSQPPQKGVCLIKKRIQNCKHVKGEVSVRFALGFYSLLYQHVSD